MNLRREPSFTFERPDGTRQSFDYERARRDDLHLAPVSFDLFCRLEDLPVFSAEMTALWISEREPLPELSMVIAGAHDPEELSKRQKFALFPMMLRLQALRDLRAHPSVQRFAASGSYRDLWKIHDFAMSSCPATRCVIWRRLPIFAAGTRKN